MKRILTTALLIAFYAWGRYDGYRDGLHAQQSLPLEEVCIDEACVPIADVVRIVEMRTSVGARSSD